ncbi:hypothetical protein GBA52_010655 [Prunus armeniaca]|nr:hypothetical protein GBA52_010655 [Prunus armeniaca]
MDGGDGQVGCINRGRGSGCAILLPLLPFEGSNRKMSSQSDMSNSQEMPSNGSTFRDDGEDEDVVAQMYEATDQMGEEMLIGLGGNFEY